jgi:hypothetical protein
MGFDEVNIDRRVRLASPFPFLYCVFELFLRWDGFLRVGNLYISPLE